MTPDQYLGRTGVWTMDFDAHPAGLVRDAAAELDELGYGTLWVAEAFGRDAFAQSALLLEATSRMVVATGVANIFLRHPLATVNTQHTLAEAYGGRFLLGLGGHRTTDQPSLMGVPFHGNAVEVMTEYLDTMDGTEYHGVKPPNSPKRVLGVLGPKMLELSARRAWGAHTYLISPSHTAEARGILGPDAVLAVEQTVILHTDLGKAKQQARAFMGGYLTAARHQRNNMRRMGFTEEDLADGGSDRLVDALISYGDKDRIAARVKEHFDAGADHVCVQVLTQDKSKLPMAEWRELARDL
jgi:probable F420-dependent oxidoreductase